MSASRIYEADDINTVIEREKEIKNGKEKSIRFLATLGITNLHSE